MTEARVSLFDGLLPSGINSHCDAYVDKDGDLVIETQDLGEAVRAIFGDSDYEYWIRVRAPQTTRLAELLAGAPSKIRARDDQLLLKLVQERFGGRSNASSLFQQWLDENEIAYEFFSYI